jgi:predicted class III extradiol MEMO1 family dioxygenase
LPGEIHTLFVLHLGGVLSGGDRGHARTEDSRNGDVRLVPIMVGHPSPSQLQQLNTVLEPYWHDPETFFIVSSDFCHWYVSPLLLPHVITSR